MSSQFATVTTAPALTSAPSSWKITDDLDPTTEMPVDVWLPTGPPAVGDRVIYDVVAGQVVVTASVAAQGVWRNYTPVLQASGGSVVSCTVTRARYMILGKTVICQGDITANALCSQATVTLPLTAKDRVLLTGSCGVFGTTFPSDQSGAARMGSNKFTLVVVAWTGGFRDCASGSSLQWSVQYELP
jgi:hypothetical protein